jgi:Domain of unknown function (DUF4158)
MMAMHETASPRIQSNLSDQELRELYTPSADDLAFICDATKSAGTALRLAILLKICQRLGYCPAFDALPPRRIASVAGVMGTPHVKSSLQPYEVSGYRWRHLPLIRTHLQSTAFSDCGRRVLVGAVLEGARSKDSLADIINVGIEALVQARYELPAFRTLRRVAQKARAQVNQRYSQQADHALNDVQRATIARLLTREAQDATSLWQRLQREPRQPTSKRIRAPITHVPWLQSLNTARQVVDDIPEPKGQRVADEARALNVARMQERSPPKRLTLAVTLIRVQTVQA